MRRPCRGHCCLSFSLRRNLSNNWINPRKSDMFQPIPKSAGALRPAATGGERRFSVIAVDQLLSGGSISKNRTSK
jgi:hypothetical protein